MLDSVIQYSMNVLGIIGALAFMVTIITEMTKDIKPIKKIPTRLYTIIVSMIVNFLFLIIYETEKTVINPSYYLSAFMGAFVVAYISTYGWDSFNELKNRFIIERINKIIYSRDGDDANE